MRLYTGGMPEVKNRLSSFPADKVKAMLLLRPWTINAHGILTLRKKEELLQDKTEKVIGC